MSTVRSIERRLYVRRQLDRDMASQVAVAGGEIPRHMEWNGIWTGYMTFAGVALILLTFVLAVGFRAMDPFSGDAWLAVGRQTLGWSVVMVLIATFLGCWVAARTPRTTRKHGMMRGITLWGMILLSVLVLGGWVSSSITRTAPVATAPAAVAPVAAPGAVAPATGAAAPAAAPIAPVHRARDFMWAFFWIALIGLGCALFGGAIGGGGVSLPGRGKLPHPASQPVG